MRWAWLLPLAACDCGVEPDDSQDGLREYPWVSVDGPVLEGRAGGGAGVGLSAGDLDGDGMDELLVAEWNDAASCDGSETCATAWLLTVPAQGGALGDAASAWFTASSEALSSGSYAPQRGMAFPGDLNGDGSQDILLLADRWPDEDPGYDPDSQVFLLWTGPFDGEVAREDAVAMVDPMPGVRDHAPCDADGDDQPDLCTNGGLLRGPLADEIYAHAIECDFARDLFWYSTGVSRFIEAGDVRGTGASNMVRSAYSRGWEDGGSTSLVVHEDGDDPCERERMLGYDFDDGWYDQELDSSYDAVVDGDITDNGADDILMTGLREGLRHLVVVPITETDLFAPSFSFGSELPGHDDDSALLSDFDGDGHDDLAWSSAGGWVSVFRGPLDEGEYGEADADVTLIGLHEPSCDSESCSVPDGFGHSIAAGDFDGDGRADLAIGAPGHGETSGKVYIAWGGGL